MNWQPFSLHFRQLYAGGYRYLDKAGELMLRAETELDLMPDEVKPTGARMEVPEEGLVVVVDTSQIQVSQEIVKDRGQVFQRICQGLTAFVGELFAPARIQSNGYAAKSYWPATSVDTAREMSLRIADAGLSDMAKTLGMVPCENVLDRRFTSGSYELHVRLLPVTFETVKFQRVNAGARASAEAVRRAKRLNQKNDRIGDVAAHALMLELDLAESDPPAGSLDAHFNRLLQQEECLQKALRPA